MKTQLAISLLFFSSACKMAPGEDSGEVNCLETCTSELQIDLADVGESYQVMIYGDQFNTLNVACPDGIQAGGPGQVTAMCVESGVHLSGDGYLFPAELTLSVDNGEEQIIAPDWVDSEVCGVQCNSADVSL
jgi:hypothetical protein